MNKIKAKSENVNKKPVYLSVIPENIPDELKNRDQWVVWRGVCRNGKWTKPPFNATSGKAAAVNDSETWSDFDTTLNTYRSENYDGIGFVLSEADPFSGADFDHCLNPETLEIAEPFRKYVKILDTYTELSPSGDGMHCFVCGKLPEKGRKKDNSEFYNTGRYLTVTGNLLNGNREIEHRERELFSVHSEIFGKVSRIGREEEEVFPSPPVLSDADILEKAYSARNGAKLSALMAGNFDGYSSQSDADLALCGKLAFWFGKDASSIDSVFRQSGLMREKWDIKHKAGGETYGEITIAKAVGGCSEVYTGRKSGKPSDNRKPATGVEIPDDFEDRLFEESADNPGFAFQPENLAMGAGIKSRDPSRWMNLKDRIKKARFFSFSDFEKAVSQIEKKDPETSEKKTVASLLIEIGLRSELFTSGGEGFITVVLNGHHETFPLMSSACKKYLQKIYFAEHTASCNENTLKEAISMLNALAENEKEHPVFCRVGSQNDAIYVDLCNENWEIVKISVDGWEITTDSAVKFVRSPSMLPLPKPVKDKDGWNHFRRFLNYKDAADFRLIVAWLVGAFSYARPYPILVIQGEEGTAKSTTVSLLKDLTDPNKVPRRSVPREERDLMISAHFSHVLSYDNLSGLPSWLSDAFCRLSTGGGFATRSLYTNNEETVFEAKKPVLLCGIENILTANDFADRSMVINLDFIPEERRQDEKTFMADFEKVRPGILGKIFDAVSAALKNLPNTELPQKPRMADFALWVQAAEPSLPWQNGEFLEDYGNNRQEIIKGSVGSSLVEKAINKFLEEDNFTWRGSATELLGILNEKCSEKITGHKKFPKTANGLSGQINKAARSMRANGINFDSGRGKNGRFLSFSKIESRQFECECETCGFYRPNQKYCEKFEGGYVLAFEKCKGKSYTALN
ncbi:hypothetical protein QUF80_07885 [Desulfococcaceae bacterium HSG8]|nr:hypothetical protein [Desulfococcaceae bacterium HSG8]